VVGELGAQFIHQLGLHELEIIRNVEADRSLGLHRFRELPPETIQVGLLHADDEVGPSKVALGDDDAGVGLRAGGPRLKQGHAFEHLLGSQASHAVLTAHEEDFERFRSLAIRHDVVKV
jgi:hypothetical protein